MFRSIFEIFLSVFVSISVIICSEPKFAAIDELKNNFLIEKRKEIQKKKIKEKERNKNYN